MKFFFAVFIISTLLLSCKKAEPLPESPITGVALQQAILEDFSLHLAHSVYVELSERAAMLTDAVVQFHSDPTAENLELCRQLWRTARSTWEHSEAWLFGPVSYDNIDPRIDTWPVNFTDLETELAGSEEFTQDHINELQDALKGFHPMEYLLFGQTGMKEADDFTEREFDFLSALSLNLKGLVESLADQWDPTNANAFLFELNTAGTGSTTYPTFLSAFEELVTAMAGICDEVANGKMGEPFISQDPSLEESPYSANSLEDFSNNIRGVKAVYLCSYSSDGTGLEDLVRQNNLSLDGTIKIKCDQAIASLDAISLPFGQAIIDQPLQVQQAIDAINALAETLETELLPYVQSVVE